MKLNGEILKNIMKGVGIALIFTIISLFVFSAILTYTDTPENVINPVIIVVTAISILIGSSIASIKLKKNGILNGALVGVIYMLLIYMVSSIINLRFDLNIQAILFIIIGIAFGMLGGVIGVNRK